MTPQPSLLERVPADSGCPWWGVPVPSLASPQWEGAHALSGLLSLPTRETWGLGPGLRVRMMPPILGEAPEAVVGNLELVLELS